MIFNLAELYKLQNVQKDEEEKKQRNYFKTLLTRISKLAGAIIFKFDM